MNTSICKREKCTNKVLQRGLCTKHRDLDLRASGFERGRVDSSTVLPHVRHLHSQDMSIACIAKEAGVGNRTLRRIMREEVTLIQKNTANKLLAVKPASLQKSANAALISAIGTVRRLRALYAMGNDCLLLSRESGVNEKTVRQLINGHQSLVHAKTARKCVVLFERLQLAPALTSHAALRSINRANKLGWAKPLEWDEDDIDNPDASPYVSVKPDWWSEYKAYKEQNLTIDQIASIFGVNKSTFKKRLTKALAA